MNRFLRIMPLLIAAACAAVPILIASPPPAIAEHSWGDYHWARKSNPFTLKVGNNLSGAWVTGKHLNVAITDWNRNQSTYLGLVEVPGSTISKNCRPTAGRIEVCNSKYGNNGWLGLAQIWASGSHITQATTKVNDTYFSTAAYNSPAWRQLVMCQEIAHDFGLDHQDENFNNPNLGSCMDYTSNPDSNQHPNAHDYEHLVTIYDHLDSTTTIGSTIAPAPGRSGTTQDEGPNNPAEFGQPTGRRDGQGRHDLFVKTLPNGDRLFTHVFWTPGGPGRP